MTSAGRIALTLVEYGSYVVDFVNILYWLINIIRMLLEGENRLDIGECGDTDSINVNDGPDAIMVESWKENREISRILLPDCT